MRARTVAGAIVGLAMVSTSACACDGFEIFSDDFSDVQISMDTWRLSTSVTISQGYMEIRPPSATVPLPARLKDFELCTDIISPDDVRQPQRTMAGLMIWYKPKSESYDLLVMAPNGIVIPMRSANGRTVPLANVRVFDAVRKGAGARNALRFSVKGNVATVYANGQRLTSFRGGDISGAIAGGYLFAQLPGGKTGWRFTNIKLSDPPK